MNKKKEMGFFEFGKDRLIPMATIVGMIDGALPLKQSVDVSDVIGDFKGGYEATLKPIGNPGFGLFHNFTPLRWTKNHEKVVKVTDEFKERIIRLQDNCGGDITVKVRVSPLMGDIGSIDEGSEIKCK